MTCNRFQLAGGTVVAGAALAVVSRSVAVYVASLIVAVALFLALPDELQQPPRWADPHEPAQCASIPDAEPFLLPVETGRSVDAHQVEHALSAAISSQPPTAFAHVDQREQELANQLANRGRRPDWSKYYKTSRTKLLATLEQELNRSGNRDPAWRQVGGEKCSLPKGTY